MRICNQLFNQICLSLVCFFGFQLSAQNYPIQSTLFLAPPYTLSLPQYANSNERFNVQLLNKDFATPIVQVYLQLRIDGPGITLETKANFRSPIPITLTAGIPTALSGVDLAELFNPNNLNFQGLNYSQFLGNGSYLPQGLYTFSIVAKAYDNAAQVSNIATATTGIFKHLPPIINLPFDRSYVNNQTPQFFQIQFTPRHTISAELISAIRYRIRINEVYPATRNPNEVMQSSNLPFFETITDQTTLIYSGSEPMLMDGRTYAIQVQAIDVNGKDLFDNNGLSQVVTFIYGSACPVPQNLTVQVGDGSGLQINWEANQRCRSYVVNYKETDKRNFITTIAYTNELLIPQLKVNQLYDIKVSGVCAESESESTPIIHCQTVQKESAYQQFSKQCGKDLPTIDLNNKQALILLETGDVIKAADFDVKVTAASGSNGWFSGAGLVTLPFTGKIPLPCTFDHIFINTDKRLVNGKINLLQAPFEISDRTVKNIGKTWRTLFGTNWNQYSSLKYQGIIKNIIANSNGDIEIEGSDGKQKLPKGSNTILTDANGKKYFISGGGQISQAEGPAAEPIVKDLKTGEGTPNSLPPGMAKVFFNAIVAQGYDALELAQLTAGKTYDQLETSDTNYYAPWKLIKTGESITIEAQVIQSKKWPCPLDSIRFVRSDGTMLPFTKKGNTFTINATGRLHLYVDAIWAVATYSIAPKLPSQRWVLGKLNLINVDVKKQNIVLIPVNGLAAESDASALQDKINQYWKAYALQANISKDKGIKIKDYDVLTESFEAEKTEIQLGYAAPLKRIIEAYKNERTWLNKSSSNDTAYVFVLNLSKAEVKGFMSMGEQFGFIFLNNGELKAHTIAHEIGHGCFQLEHVFGNDLVKSGISQNLMDYAPPYSVLNFDQWMQIHDPQIKVKLFANEDKSKWIHIPDISKFKPLANNNNTYTFISHSGEYLTLPATASNLQFSTLGRGYLIEEKNGVEIRKATDHMFPLGCLLGFELKGIKYRARMGIGYVDANEKAYEGELSSNESQAGIMPFLVFKNNQYTTKAAQFKSRLGHLSSVKNGEGQVLKSFAVIDFETSQLNTNYTTAILSKKIGDKIIEDIGASFTLFGNDQLNFKYNDTVYNASRFLIKILSTQQTVSDYVYYFNLVNLKPNSYASFVNCMSDRIQERAIGIQQTLLTQRLAIKGESTAVAQYINSNSEQLFEAVNAIQLKDLATNVPRGTQLIAAIKKAEIEKWPADYLYRYLKNNPVSTCEWTALETQERIYVVNQLIGNADYWHLGSTNLILTLLQTTPEFDALEILQKGVMANKYYWLKQLWKNREDEDIGPVFDIVNTWVYDHYEKLKITPTSNALVAEDLFNAPINYQRNNNEFFIGIKANTADLAFIPHQFTLTCKHLIMSGGIAHPALASDIAFLDNGSISFNQTYWINDIRPQLYNENHKPNLRSVVDYSEAFSPFEIITVTMGGNYFDLDLSVGQSMEMPAFMAMQMQHRLEEHVEGEQTRALVNKAMIGITAISAVYTGGASLNLTAALFVATSTADLAISSYKSTLKTQAEWDANKDFFYEWEAFHTATEYAMAIEGAYALGKVIVPRLGSKLSVLRNWSSFRKHIKRTLINEEKLVKILDELIAEVKGIETSSVQSLTKLEKVSASIKINWKNLNSNYIVWADAKSNILSTAKTFAEETGVTLYDAVLNEKFYIKIDISDGRILLGETNGTYHAFGIIEDKLMSSFKSSLLTLGDDAFKKAISDFICIHADKLKIISGVSTKSLSIAGKVVNLSKEKVNTILGRYNPDIKELFNNLGSYKNVGLGENKGGVNLLNRPRHYDYFSPEQWWNTWNKNWLETAINRGDDIYLATEVSLSKLIDVTKKPTTFSFEIRELVKREYKPCNVNESEWLNIKNLVFNTFGVVK